MYELNVRVLDLTYTREIRGTVNPEEFSEVIQQEPIIMFMLSYPLTNKSLVSLTHADKSPWTMYQFIMAIHETYQAIYDEEDTETYGIFGHDLGELVLEGLKRDTNGVWSVFVGS